MIYYKILYGYVVQSYDSETGDCVAQEFVSDGKVLRQDENGTAIPEGDALEYANSEKECSPDMVQP